MIEPCEYEDLSSCVFSGGTCKALGLCLLDVEAFNLDDVTFTDEGDKHS
jgi:hypothetical protein